MSSLFNQTNISPRTSFFGSNGNSNFPQGININANGASGTILTVTSGFATGNAILGVLAQETPNFITAPIGANTFQAWDFLGQTNYANYSSAAITYVNNAGSSSNLGVANFLSQNLSNNISLDITNLVFQLKGLSSIQAGSNVVDANKLCSTIKGYGWA